MGIYMVFSVASFVGQGPSPNPRYETWRIVGRLPFPCIKMCHHCIVLFNISLPHITWQWGNIFNAEMQSNLVAALLKSGGEKKYSLHWGLLWRDIAFCKAKSFSLVIMVTLLDV